MNYCFTKCGQNWVKQRSTLRLLWCIAIPVIWLQCFIYLHSCKWKEHSDWSVLSVCDSLHNVLLSHSQHSDTLWPSRHACCDRRKRISEQRLLQQAKDFTNQLAQQKLQLEKADEFPDNSVTEVSQMRGTLLSYHNNVAATDERLYQLDYKIQWYSADTSGPDLSGGQTGQLPRGLHKQYRYT